MDKKFTHLPDEHMRWIYNPYHPDYHSERAKDLRMRRWVAFCSMPSWMLAEATSNDREPHS